MDGPKRLFFLTNLVFLGFLLSALYGALSATAVWSVGSSSEATQFLVAYFKTFNSAVSGGLVFALAFLVYRTQGYIPGIIETTFTRRELEVTPYFSQKKELHNSLKSVRLSSGFAIIAMFIFYFADFPSDGLPEHLLIAAGCCQYAAGVYVGRKIFYVAQLLRSIEEIRVTKELFRQDKLAGVSLYVNSISTATAFSVYIGVISYYRAPFTYKSVVGEAMVTAMLLPAIIAIPVLLIAYYSRSAVRRIYEKSIELSVRRLTARAENNHLKTFETETEVVDFHKLHLDELNRKLRTTMEDLPMAVVVGLALLSAFKG